MSTEIGTYDRNDADGAIARLGVTSTTFGSKTNLNTVTMPYPLEVRKSYNADFQVEYEGYGPIDAETDEEVWAIKKVTYDTNNLPTREQWKLNGKWDLRASYF